MTIKNWWGFGIATGARVLVGIGRWVGREAAGWLIGGVAGGVTGSMFLWLFGLMVGSLVGGLVGRMIVKTSVWIDDKVIGWLIVGLGAGLAIAFVIGHEIRAVEAFNTRLGYAVTFSILTLCFSYAVRVIKRISRDRKARAALLDSIILYLEKAASVEEMAQLWRVLEHFPDNAEQLPKGWNEVQRRLNTISSLAQDYLARTTLVGQIKVLEELRSEVQSFRHAMTLIKPPVGPSFQALASRWLAIIQWAEPEARKKLSFTPIPNPFIVGNPLQKRDDDLFKGRRDIIVAIEENIVNTRQRPALLLYGRKRIGKSSTLLNLPRLLSSRYIPVFIDCQEAKWRDSDGAFCYHLVSSIYAELQQRNLQININAPRREEFKAEAFTKFAEYLDKIEDASRRAGKQILLTFDEYERMEVGIKKDSITEDVFNQIRHIVQHRQQIVVLFSGSHRLEELRVVNWSDYLNNVKVLELSFLAPEDARELVERPVPDFKMRYEAGVVDRILELTHCHPYLLQAVASELVDSLNFEKRMTATMEDLEAAVEKVLVTVQHHFYYTWTEDCTEEEREILLAMASDETTSFPQASHQAALRSLERKEVLEKSNNRYRLAVELFRLWILKEQMPEVAVASGFLAGGASRQQPAAHLAKQHGD